MLQSYRQVSLIQIYRPIKNTKENLALANLIVHANYKPEINFLNILYD